MSRSANVFRYTLWLGKELGPSILVLVSLFFWNEIV